MATLGVKGLSKSKNNVIPPLKTTKPDITIVIANNIYNTFFVRL